MDVVFENTVCVKTRAIRVSDASANRDPIDDPPVVQPCRDVLVEQLNVSFLIPELRIVFAGGLDIRGADETRLWVTDGFVARILAVVGIVVADVVGNVGRKYKRANEIGDCLFVELDLPAGQRARKPSAAAAEALARAASAGIVRAVDLSRPCRFPARPVWRGS